MPQEKKNKWILRTISCIVINAFLLLEYLPYSCSQTYRNPEEEEKKPVFRTEKPKVVGYLPEPVPVGGENTQQDLKKREALKETINGLREAGYRAKEIIRLTTDKSDKSRLNEIIIGLRKAGVEIGEIELGLEELGYKREDIEKVLSGLNRAECPAGRIDRPIVKTVKDRFKKEETKDASETLSRQTGEASSTSKETKFQETEIPNNLEETNCGEELKQLSEQGVSGEEAARELKKEGHGVKEIVSAFIEKALNWLEEKSVELINCAAYALASFLGLSGKGEDLTEAAVSVIYEDILIKGEVTLKEGRIETSMEAIEEAGKKQGIELTAYQIKAEDILRIKEPAIAHLKAGHWIVVTEINEETVSIIDNGQRENLSVEEFKAEISGNILTSEKISEAKELKKEEAKEISGSGWLKKVGNFCRKIVESVKHFLNTSIGKIVILVVVTVITAGLAGLITNAIVNINIGSVMAKALGWGISAFVTTFGTCKSRGDEQ